jgi:hypothetical protein
MIVLWTAISYSAFDSVPAGIPRRLSSPNPWSPGASSNWAVIKVIGSSLYSLENFETYCFFLYLIKYLIMISFKSVMMTLCWQSWQDMHKVPPLYILAAFIPAIMIAGLYFFDHSVAAQMAQQKEFNLRNPSAYHYDLLLLGIMVCVLICLQD